VLGCTHYPFVIEAIRRLVGPGVTVIDPAPAVARHLGSLLERHGLGAPPGSPCHRFLTTGDAARFDRDARQLIGIETASLHLPWRAATAERLELPPLAGLLQSLPQSF
jgi:glutamate racemase